MSRSAQNDFENLKPGDSASCTLEVTSDVIARYAAFSGDDNRLHLQREVAHELGFPAQVAHGMIGLGLISRLIGSELPGHGSLWMAQDLKFTQPVFQGDTIEARVVVEKVSRAARVVVLRTEVMRVSPREVVLQGTAQVRVPGVDATL